MAPDEDSRHGDRMTSTLATLPDGPTVSGDARTDAPDALLIGFDPLPDDLESLCTAAGFRPRAASRTGAAPDARRAEAGGSVAVLSAAAARDLAGTGADGLRAQVGSPTSPIVVATGAIEDAEWRAALAIGARTVLRLPGEEALLLEALMAGRSVRAREADRIGVCGVRGGAGASSLAARLAAAAGRGGRETVLIDAAGPLGGLAPLVRAEDLEGARYEDLDLGGATDPGALVRALIEVDGYRLLTVRGDVGGAGSRHGDGGASGAVRPAPVGRALDLTGRACECVLVDLPPLTVLAAGTPVAARIGSSSTDSARGLLERLDLLVVVVPQDEVSRALARRASELEWPLPVRTVARLRRGERQSDLQAPGAECGWRELGWFRDDRRAVIPGAQRSRSRTGADQMVRQLMRAGFPDESARSTSAPATGGPR